MNSLMLSHDYSISSFSVRIAVSSVRSGFGDNTLLPFLLRDRFSANCPQTDEPAPEGKGDFRQIAGVRQCSPRDLGNESG